MIRGLSSFRDLKMKYRHAIDNSETLNRSRLSGTDWNTFCSFAAG